jgi:hypothetical protein
MEVSETAYGKGKPKRESVQLRRILALVIPLKAVVGGPFCLFLLTLEAMPGPFLLGGRKDWF